MPDQMNSTAVNPSLAS